MSEQHTTATGLQHRLGVRIWHWVNALSFLMLVISGIGIILYHPEFYWGEAGYFGLEAWLTLPLEVNKMHTSWGRNVHFLFAWVFVINAFIYLLTGLLNGHFFRAMLPSREQLKPQQVKYELTKQLAFKKPTAQDLITYNLVQKVSYLLVIFVMFPVMLLSGMAMSPGFVSAMPELTDLFGGRQSARSIHFILACLLLLFLIVHLVKTIQAGFRRVVGPMITGAHTQLEDKS